MLPPLVGHGVGCRPALPDSRCSGEPVARTELRPRIAGRRAGAARSAADGKLWAGSEPPRLCGPGRGGPRAAAGKVTVPNSGPTGSPRPRRAGRCSRREADAAGDRGSGEEGRPVPPGPVRSLTRFRGVLSRVWPSLWRAQFPLSRVGTGPAHRRCRWVRVAREGFAWPVGRNRLSMGTLVGLGGEGKEGIPRPGCQVKQRFQK